MGKIARNSFLSLLIGAALIAAASARPAEARHAGRHYAAACHSCRAAWCRGAWCGRPVPSWVRQAEDDALLQCLMNQPFLICN
jgi:hypothetical protein